MLPQVVRIKNGYALLHETGIYYVDDEHALKEYLDRIALESKIMVRTDKLKEKLAKVVIFVTSNCNLRCVYCYADSGKKSSVVSIENAITLIKHIAEKVDKFILDFHGGGEPLLCFDAIKAIHDYAKSTGKLYRTVLISNGVIETRRDEILNWIVSNVNVMALSCDGPAKIQNMQRPRISGDGSIDSFLNTVDFFNKHNFAYTVRSTITGYSARYLKDIIEYFYSVGIKNVVFAPCYNYGRSNDRELVPNVDEYCDNYMQAIRFACEHDMRLTSNSLRFPGYSYCGALGGFNVALTTDNYISTCYEVVSNEDPVAKYFIIGRIEDGRIIINHEKLNNLPKLNVATITNCGNCNLKLVCRGGCPVKKIRQDKDSLLNLCAITKKLVPLLLTYLKDNPQYANNVLRYVRVQEYS